MLTVLQLCGDRYGYNRRMPAYPAQVLSTMLQARTDLVHRDQVIIQWRE